MAIRQILNPLIFNTIPSILRSPNYFNHILAILCGKTYLYYVINGFSFSLLAEVAFLKSDSVHCNN